MAGSRRLQSANKEHVATQTLLGNLASAPFMPYTFMGWMRPRTTTVDCNFWGLANNGASNEYYFLGLNTDGGTPEGAQGLIRDGTQLIITPDVTRVWVVDEWVHLAYAVTASGAMKGFLDGVKDSTATTRTPDNIDTLSLGWLLDSNPPAASADADIAWCTLHNDILTDAEIQAAARGPSPMRTRPSELLSVYPFWENTGTDDVRDIWGGNDLETYHTAALSNPGADIAPSASGPPMELWWPGKGRSTFEIGAAPAVRNRFHAA